MKLKRYLILILAYYAFAPSINAQTLERTYVGNWARTTWTYNLYSDSTFEFITFGHFGNTKSKGTYYILDDSLFLLRDSGNAMGIKEKFIIEGDSVIVDYNLRYDYKSIDKAPALHDSKRLNEYLFMGSYNSQERHIKYPQVITTNNIIIRDVDTVLNMAFNSKEMRQFYHFDSLPQRRLLVTNYYELNTEIKVDSMTAIFQTEVNMKGLFYISIDDINVNETYIDINLSINKEGVSMWFRFEKENGQWVYRKPHIIER